MSDESAGKLINPQIWRSVLPLPVFEALSEWVEGQAFDVQLRRWRTEGKSGSFVAQTQLVPRRGMIVGAFLKILPSDLAKRESQATTLAEREGPGAFVAAHLTRTIWIGPLPGNTGRWLHLQEVAQAGSARMLPLSDLMENPGFAEFCAVVIESIATEWNDGQDDPPPTMTSPGAFLRSDLASRLDGLRAFVSAAGWDFDRPHLSVQLPGRPTALANPLLLLQAGDERGDHISVFRGRGHGDLHTDNILLPERGDTIEAERFRLVDFGRFSRETPVSRDPAKLLLSIAARWLPGLSAESAIRSSLAELVVAPHEFPPSPPIVGYRQVALKIHEAAASWAVRRSLAADWPEQHRVVLAAAALRSLARDDIPIEDRWWHLEVAAIALQPFIPPPDGGAMAVPPPTPPTAARPLTTPAMTTQRGAIKVEFSRRLGVDWQDLADILDIPLSERRRFPHGDEARYIWEWLEVRAQLPLLYPAVINIGRIDLARLVIDLDTK